MTQPIEGKIVKILDQYSILINKGSRDGVKEGMSFVIFTLTADEVEDPSTKEALGRLEVVKGYVVALHVQDRITTCVAKKKDKGNGQETGASGQTLSAAMIAECMATRSEGDIATERMNVNTSQISGMPQVGPISIGDYVRSIE